MTTSKFGLLAALAVAGSLFVFSANADVGTEPAGSLGHLVPPAATDDYGKLAARAFAHDPGLDFRALRFAWLDSAARKLGDEDDLEKALFDAVKTGDFQSVRDAAEKLLSVNYVNMWGQKFLRQSCAALHDAVCEGQAHYMEFGLLNSIVKSGDGKTCATGWEVVEVKEEYFVLAMIGAHPKMQSLQNGKPSCDVMSTTGENGEDATYYFRIDAVLADEAKMLGGK